MKPGCTLVAYLHGKPERRAELFAVLREFVVPTRAEPGCIEYHLHVSDDDPNLFVFYENRRTRKDLDEYLQQPLLKAFFERRMELLKHDVDIRFLSMDSACEVSKEAVR